MDTDRLIKHGLESTTSEWLRECCEMERDYDSYPQEAIEGSAAMTGWPYDAPIQDVRLGVDMVNHPKHYTFSKYEVIDVCEEFWPDDPHLFQAGQYMARAKHKGQFVQDLEKTIWFIRRRIEVYKRTGK